MKRRNRDAVSAAARTLRVRGVMRVKRARKVRKYLRYYRTCHGFRAPYKVRLATPSTRLAEPAFANLERRAAAVSPAGFPPTVHARPLSPPAERCPSRADLERTWRGDRMPRAVSGSSSATRDVTPIRVRDAPGAQSDRPV